MIIYPSIELQKGRCVSLHRGNIDEPQIWHVDPLAKAKSYVEAGASWISLTDLDGITQRNRNNNDISLDIILHSGASVQMGGGFCSIHQISDWIDKGAARIVVSTLAVLQPRIVQQAAKMYPDQIVVAVDVFRGSVMSDGWRHSSAITPQAFVETFANDPLAAIIVTDIDADLGEAEDSLALITALAGLSNAPVIARGLSRTMDDLSRLHYVPHVAGAIIDRPLFDKSIDLAEAITMTQPATEPPAPFI
jgi:phosphoribosylformimino-5-aminoimidazole carboxamide ribotide isomerase